MRVLIVGLGSIARKHISALNEIDKNIEIFAIRSKQTADGEENGINNLYSTSNLEDYNFSFIIISTPTFLHEQNLKELEYLKLPFFIEKPISDTLNIKNYLFRYDDFQTYVACNLRFLDSLCFLKNKCNLSELRINEVNVYAGSYLPDWRPNINYKENYSALPEKGGGVHIDLIHEIDYVYWFFGKPKDKKSYFKSNSSIDIKSIDYANYILEYDYFTVSIILNYYRKDSKRYIEVITDKHSFYIDLLNNEVFRDNISIFKSEQKIIDTYKAQLEYFIDVLNKKETSFNTLKDGVEVLNICIG
jgi:predicted dehydrogenase